MEYTSPNFTFQTEVRPTKEILQSQIQRSVHFSEANMFVPFSSGAITLSLAINSLAQTNADLFGIAGIGETSVQIQRPSP